jgi:hypothetical protein
MGAPNATYMPKRTYVVDSGSTTFLIRGNEPLNDDGSFAYDAINKKLQELIVDFNLEEYKLITISLIDNNPSSERPDLNKEFLAYGITQKEFDKDFPYPSSWPPVYRGIDVSKQYGEKVEGNKGSIVWWPVQGCSSMDNCALVEPPQYNFSGIVDYLHTLVSSSEKLVIYYHCEHGHDRTSALTAAYMLKYMNRTLDQVLTQRPPIGAKAFKHDWASTYEQLIRYYNNTL